MSQSITIKIQDAIENIEGYIRERREHNRPVTLKAISVRLSLLAPLYQAKVLLHLSKDTSLPAPLRIDMKTCASMIIENIEANRTASASSAVQQMEKDGTQQQPTPTPTPTPVPIPTTPQQPLSVPPVGIPSTPIASSSTPTPATSEQSAPLPPQTVAPEDVSAQRSRIVMSRRGPPASWSNVPTAV